MIKILTLVVMTAFMMPATFASAHHDSRKYSKQKYSQSYKQRSKKSFQRDSSTPAEKAQRASIAHYYSDYPAWAGIAFSPQIDR